ncbi:hypothetical protein [Rhizobium nepotum]|uniref:HTH iclR-type domain-containing protein n=1 Tax=Rhizobium nepotum 39/7 TaxID=1368418 RepID=A0ABR5CRF2_9HYPH|nr:hypothetical protein [Rhizobium nepotum]KJF67421.1 hypothetical protein RS75_13185 [Rhizobium nepotum 39/7]
MMQDKSTLHFDRIFNHLPPSACLTVEVLEEVAGLSRSQIFRVLGKMVTAGLIQRRKVGCYQLTIAGLKAKRTGVVQTPVQPTRAPTLPADSFRQRLWSVMRMSGAFVAAELVMAANWPLKRPEVEAGKYLRALKRAGYLIELPNGARGQIRYRLIRNSGQLAPLVSSVDGTVYDPNTREAAPCAKQA